MLWADGGFAAGRVPERGEAGCWEIRINRICYKKLDKKEQQRKVAAVPFLCAGANYAFRSYGSFYSVFVLMRNTVTEYFGTV